MSLIERARRNPILRSIYKLPGVGGAYHFALAALGAALFGFPSRKLTVIGVTGTKGKTTTCELLASVLEAAGRKTAVLTSVHFKVGERDVPNRTGNSMPGRFAIQRLLADAVKAGCTHAVIEVTSEGVAQQRHRFINWGFAAITNIAPEHIESHGSFEKYRDTKLAFLQYAASQGATAFVNSDDERSGYFKEKLPAASTILYSTKPTEDWPHGLFAVLPGEFNRQNVAAVLAVSRKLDIADDTVKSALERFKGVPGRMDFVAREPFRVVVDYAHTPDSLEAAYKALRADMQPGAKLIAVFGSCGGHRDKWKRPVMGAVAAKHADKIVLTDEDPFDEDPQKILDEVRVGIDKASFPPANVSEVLDRKAAIRKALSLARPGDTVVMTGKGSEAAIRVAGGKTIEWSDKAEAQKALEEIQ